MSAVEQFLVYNFDGDADFQDEQKPSISQSAQWVSFGTWSHARQRKTGMNISWDEVQAHITTTKDANRDRKDDEMRTSATQPNVQEPQQLSIAEVTRLIESGQIHLIPNTRTIPEHLNEAPPSQAQAPQRCKPWE